MEVDIEGLVDIEVVIFRLEEDDIDLMVVKDEDCLYILCLLYLVEFEEKLLKEFILGILMIVLLFVFVFVFVGIVISGVDVIVFVSVYVFCFWVLLCVVEGWEYGGFIVCCLIGG